MATGTATINFGATPGHDCTTLDVVGQTGILATSYIEAFMMAETTADHNECEHCVVDVKLTCGNIVPNTSFTIYAKSIDCLRLTGTFKVRWVWT